MRRMNSRMGAGQVFLCRITIGIVVCLVLTLGAASAAEFLESFDGPDTSWQVLLGSRACRVVDHRRHAQIRKFGTGAENVVFDSRGLTLAELHHGLSPARVLEESLTATAWVRSNRSGATLSLRIVYPHVIDPETGKIAFRWIDGDSYSSYGKWQQLTCKTSEIELTRRNQLLRAQLGAAVDLHDAYVDRARLTLELGEGATELFIDDLKLTPVVSPGVDTPQLADDQPEAVRYPEFKMQHDRLLLDGVARFPTFIPYHNEPPAELANLGTNLVWIPRYDDRKVIEALSHAGIGVMATPPLALDAKGDVLDADTAGLAPLNEDLDPILFWMLGNEIPASGKRKLSGWQKQLLSADRRRQRPLIANVVAGERGFSRLIDMLGVSRSVNGTGLDYLQYRDWLVDRQLSARPGSFMWTWIETEPLREVAARRSSLQQSPVVIEPEQLRAQTYAALSSGVRGLGFWSTRGLFHEGMGAAEMRLMLKQLHYEIQLLEPWLATGAPTGEASFQLLRAPGSTTVARTRVRKPTVTPVGHLAATDRPADEPSSKIVGTLLESEFGTLLLGSWFEPNAQYVPGQMAAADVQTVVPGIRETAKAWEVSTTDIRTLTTDRNAVPGGTLIRLPVFDSTTAIVISPDLALGDDLRRRMLAIQADSATCIVQLARAKLQRVEGVIVELKSLGRAQPDTDRMLQKARQLADTAARQLSQKDFAGARRSADLSAQMLRVLQKAHWDEAAETVTHPASSPHLACFQTLPDHWKLLQKLEILRASQSPNLLHSGDFEDEDTFRTAGWKHLQSDLPGMVATAELIQLTGQRGYSLRLAAAPEVGKAVPLIVPAPPVTVISPSVSVQAGQLVRIAGRVKVVRAPRGTRDGFHVSDSLSGSVGALHFSRTAHWQAFEIVREVTATQELQVSFSLFGIGDILVDDVTIQTYDGHVALAPALDTDRAP